MIDSMFIFKQAKVKFLELEIWHAFALLFGLKSLPVTSYLEKRIAVQAKRVPSYLVPSRARRTTPQLLPEY